MGVGFLITCHSSSDQAWRWGTDDVEEDDMTSPVFDIVSCASYVVCCLGDDARLVGVISYR